MQLAPKMRSTNALVASMTGRAEVTHFAIAGRVAIGLHLFSRTPGIRGVVRLDNHASCIAFNYRGDAGFQALLYLR